MNAELYARARSVFVGAIEVAPGDREAFVVRACRSDLVLESEVRALLLAHDEARGFDSLTAPGVEAQDETRVPERIGEFKVLRVLGRGGMGVVYEAEQPSPHRVVALKVLRFLDASPARLRRFEREAEILGMLHHPGIAQVYAVGRADAGRGAEPYIAMELVEGRPLPEHAAEARLDVRAKVALLERVARAVEHAHAHGVVHRDLKPGNVLVTPDGTPKVLDFGIARAAELDRGSDSLRTREGDLLGTLPYMSPEQIGGDPAGIDLRTDVYALGVVGYELLAGRLPVPVEGESLPAAARRILEEVPAPLGSTDRALRGDLATILAKALEKDRERRYATAGRFADDLGRFLRHEPVEARDPSRIYQLSRFARRNRVLVGGVAGVFLALSGGILATTREARRANEERNLALIARGEAQKEARRSEASLEFVKNLFQSIDPDESGHDARVLDVVRMGEQRLDRAFAGDSGTEVSLRKVISVAYYGLGMSNESEASLRRAQELLDRDPKADPQEGVSVGVTLAQTLVQAGKLDDAEIELDKIEARRAQGLASPDELRASLQFLRLQILAERGRDEDAAKGLESLLEECRRTLGDGNEITLKSLNLLGYILYKQRKLEAAYALAVEDLANTRSRYGEEHSSTLGSAANLATILRDLGYGEEARSTFEHVLEVSRRRSGPTHERTLTTLLNLADVVADLPEREAAIPMYEEVQRESGRQFGPANRLTVAAATNLAWLWWTGLGRADAAEKVYRDALEAIRAAGAAETPDTLQLSFNLAVVLDKQSRVFEAEAMYADVLERAHRILPDDSWFLARYEVQYAGSLARRGCHADALPLIEDGFRRATASLGPDDKRTVIALKQLIDTCEALGLESRVKELRPLLQP